MAEAPQVLSGLVHNTTTWADCLAKYKNVEHVEESKE